jgi:Zn-dependent protease
MDLQFILVLFQVVVLLFSFSMHEAVHAYAAMRWGDPTAYMLGRVTLNPARHIDPWGSVLMPLLSFVLGGTLVGWGKPVPVTVRNFKKIKLDDCLSTAAGLLSHLALASVALLLLVALKHTPTVGESAVFSAMAMVQGQQVDLSELPKLFPVALLLYYAVVVNVLLFVFELIPVPPLDGSRFIRYVLPYNLERMYDRIGMLGSFVIFFVAWRLVLPIYVPLKFGFDLLLVKM